MADGNAMPLLKLLEEVDLPGGFAETERRIETLILFGQGHRLPSIRVLGELFDHGDPRCQRLR